MSKLPSVYEQITHPRSLTTCWFLQQQNALMDSWDLVVMVYTDAHEKDDPARLSVMDRISRKITDRDGWAHVRYLGELYPVRKIVDDSVTGVHYAIYVPTTTAKPTMKLSEFRAMEERHVENVVEMRAYVAMMVGSGAKVSQGSRLEMHAPFPALSWTISWESDRRIELRMAQRLPAKRIVAVAHMHHVLDVPTDKDMLGQAIVVLHRRLIDRIVKDYTFMPDN